MQTELRCPRCGDDLGLEDDLFDDGAPIRLRCSGCGRWLRVEVVRRLNVVDLGDYETMRQGQRTEVARLVSDNGAYAAPLISAARSVAAVDLGRVHGALGGPARRQS